MRPPEILGPRVGQTTAQATHTRAQDAEDCDETTCGGRKIVVDSTCAVGSM